MNKKSGGGITRRELIKGSVAAGGLTLLGTPAITAAQQAAAVTPPSPYADLADRLGGNLITPDNDRYDNARKVFNGMIDRHPAAIARCRGAADVMDVVKYAREHDIAISVRGGGHNVAGKAVKDGAITIDLGPMQGVWADPYRMRVRAQGGVRLRALDREALAVGMVVPSGTVGDTGVAGLTLGGGFGWLQRKHGMTIDNLISADVVTADGEFLVASASENSDLFWALRGGGGNFGVVTSFEYQAHEAEKIVGGLALYPESMIRDLLRFYRDFTASAPNSVMTMAGTMIGPPGTPVEGQAAGYIAVCYSGTTSEGERLLQPIKTFGPPAMDLIGPTSFNTIQTLFDAASIPGRQNYWRSNFMYELSDEVIDMIVARSSELPPSGSLFLVEHMGGAIRDTGPNDTAFSSRDANHNVSILGIWEDALKNEEYIAWTRKVGDELRAYATGGAYVNYMSDDGEAAIKATYEANFNRLIEVKRKYDPDNFFSSNQNIRP
jgi:FAD/FMN-containing dehydrogenase